MKLWFIPFCFLFVGNLFSQTDSIHQKNYASYVILPADSQQYIRSFPDPRRFWQPDSALVESVFAKMNSGLDSSHLRQIDSLSTYNFQVVGCYDHHFHKLLYFDACCDPEVVDHYRWKTHLHYVFDGGNCYFQVFYDVKKKKWKFFHRNGYA
jgi:hypothetical protein